MRRRYEIASLLKLRRLGCTVYRVVERVCVRTQGKPQEKVYIEGRVDGQ